MPRYLATAIGYVAGSGSFVESLRELMPFIRSTRCFHAGTGVCFVPNEMLRHDADSMVVDGLKFQISRDKRRSQANG